MPIAVSAFLSVLQGLKHQGLKHQGLKHQGLLLNGAKVTDMACRLF